MTRRESPASPPLESMASRTDGQLLDRLEGGDPGAAALAFEALVTRHGPMVLSVCRGALGDRHLAEDAFQVVFLTLSRRAGSIARRDSVASWLHGVALRVAGRVRRTEARRRALERRRGVVALAPSSSPSPTRDDLEGRVHAELARLPERLRAVVVLCDLEGHTADDASALLGCPIGTVKSRLSRARARLRDRLGPGRAMVLPPVPARLVSASIRSASVGWLGSAPPSLVAMPPGAPMSTILALGKWPAFAIASSFSLALALPGTTQDPCPIAAKPPAAKPQGPPAQAVPRGEPIPRGLSVRAGTGRAVMFQLNDQGERIAGPGGRSRIFFREELRDLRWVVAVATLDRRAAEAGEAEPEYLRVDVERQTRTDGGTWSDWTPIDVDRNYQVLDNITESTKELAPAELRPQTLVDPLPFLEAGRWEGVVPEGFPGPKRDGPPPLMIRCLDFTVEAGATYRYRTRIVVRKPSIPDPRPADPVVKIGDRRVIVRPPGTPELRRRGGKTEHDGPWSEPSAEVQSR